MKLTRDEWPWIASVVVMFAGTIVAPASCRATPPPPPAGTDCEAACERLGALGCDAGAPTPSGTPCKTWLCSTPMPSSRSSCISHAPDCFAAEECR